MVACEASGRVRAAFRELGHDAWSSEDRWMLCARTYEGVAQAMAQQWGCECCEEVQ
ncbi:hypothetical protein GCM10028796_47010 [Ramlibacter monticola]